MRKTLVFLVLSFFAIVACNETTKKLRKAKNTSVEGSWWSTNVLGQKEQSTKEKEVYDNFR